MKAGKFTAIFLRERTIYGEDLATGREDIHEFRLENGSLCQIKTTKLLKYACDKSGKSYEIEIGEWQFPVNILDLDTGTGYAKKSNCIMKYANGEEPVNLSRKHSFRLNIKKKLP